MSSDFEFVCKECKSGFSFTDSRICPSYDAYDEKGEHIRGFTPSYLDSCGDVDDSAYLETKRSILSGEYCPICEGDVDDEECDYYDERMAEGMTPKVKEILGWYEGASDATEKNLARMLMQVS